MVAQIFVIERAYSDLDSFLDDVLAESRTNAGGETSNSATPFMRMVARGVDAARGQRAGSGLRAHNLLPVLA